MFSLYYTPNVINLYVNIYSLYYNVPIRYILLLNFGTIYFVSSKLWDSLLFCIHFFFFLNLLSPFLPYILQSIVCQCSHCFWVCLPRGLLLLLLIIFHSIIICSGFIIGSSNYLQTKVLYYPLLIGDIFVTFIHSILFPIRLFVSASKMMIYQSVYVSSFNIEIGRVSIVSRRNKC